MESKLGHRSAAAVLLGAVLLAGCSQDPVPQDQFYRLQTSPAAATPGNSTRQGSIEVGRFFADGVTSGRAIVFSQANRPNQLQPYHYHFWTEPPPILLQNRLVEYLRSARVATRVVTPELRIEPDFVVTGRIQKFEQLRGNPGSVVAELELSLKETRTERLVHHQIYKVVSDTRSETPAAAVSALGQAIGRIFQSFVMDVGKR